VLDDARVAMNFAGGKIAGAIQSQEIRVVEEDVIFQDPGLSGCP
jgi:hypothetical protein